MGITMNWYGHLPELGYWVPLSCLVSIGIILILSLLITRTVAEPVQNIAESMKIFSQGNLSVRVADDARDEIECWEMSLIP